MKNSTNNITENSQTFRSIKMTNRKIANSLMDTTLYENDRRNTTMKTLNTIATSALLSIAMGTSTVANAATVATFTVDPILTTYDDNPIYDTGSYFSMTGTAVLDNSGQLIFNYIFDADYSAAGYFDYDYDMTATAILNGTWDGSTLTYTDGSTVYNTCQDFGADLGCGNYDLGVPIIPDILVDPIVFDLGINGYTTIQTYSYNTETDAYDLAGAPTGLTTVSSVPVPAAVWLFGSGLTGLIGVARRKKKLQS